MQSVADIFCARYPNVAVAIQRSGMTRQEREEFLSFFEDDVGRLRVGFCVLGGSFSEGVDLPGSRLIGTVIVGVGLPGLSAERNIIRDYFENRAECGYDYSYTYPGMNSILQAAGRVIRRPEDKGVVVLIDDRYAEEKYRMLYPPHWEGMKFAADVPSLQSELAHFWTKIASEE
jgi:Rad3-related DNA helicase